MVDITAASFRRPVVVCVDDDPSVLRALRRALQKEVYELLTTDDPVEALGQVRRNAVDVFIADERMPGITGTDLLKEVELSSPDTGRVMISAFPDPTTERSLVQHFIPKPWNDDLFRAIVRRMVGRRGKRPLQPRPTGTREEFFREIPVVVECLKKRLLDIVPPTLRLFRKARKAGRAVVLILESLSGFREDPAALLADLELAATVSGVELILVDATGLAGRYRRLRGDPSPRVSIYGPDSAAIRRKFLLVDPVSTRRVFLRLLLDGLGHSCRAVPTPEDARKVLGSEYFDRVLVDLTHPGAVMEWIAEMSGEVWTVPLIPLLPAAKTWDPSVLERWSLRPPLIRPYRFADFLEIST